VSGAVVSGAVVSGAVVSGAVVSGAVVSGAVVSGAVVSGAVVSGVGDGVARGVVPCTVGAMVRRLTALLLTVVAATASPTWAARKKAADTTPPVIDHTPPVGCVVETPCVVEARITDSSGVFDPTLLFRAAGATTFERQPMQATPGDGSLFRATLPAVLLASGDVEYLVEAFDVQGNGPSRAGNDEVPLRVKRPAVAAATTTTGSTGRPASDTPDASTSTSTPDDGDTNGAVVEDEQAGDNGLVVGLVIGGAALAVLVGGGIAWLAYTLRPTSSDVVTVTIAAPSPVPSALVVGGGR
jgi:hypothetical protein